MLEKLYMCTMTCCWPQIALVRVPSLAVAGHKSTNVGLRNGLTKLGADCTGDRRLFGLRAARSEKRRKVYMELTLMVEISAVHNSSCVSWTG
jgi:hypothetical protein